MSAAIPPAKAVLSAPACGAPPMQVAEEAPPLQQEAEQGAPEESKH
jgi:hypothetical protein